MGGGVGFFCGASNQLPTSDFLSPISLSPISLAPWLLAPAPAPALNLGSRPQLPLT